MAAALALHATGRAARLAGKGRGMIPQDVVRRLPEALSEWGTGSTDLDPSGVLLDLDPAS
jgi:NAD(P)H-hydrate epimerase